MGLTSKSSKPGILFVLSAPAGTGKTTLVHRLLKNNPKIIRSVTCTTRGARVGEVDGRDYHFLSQKEFLQKVQDGEFLEYAEVYDDLYGTLRQSVEKELSESKNVILVIDTQGAKALKEKGPIGGRSPVFVFLVPPSLVELKRRLEKRGTEDQKAMETRLAWAEEEMKQTPFYDYLIINDDLEKTFEVFSSIIIAEEHRNLKRSSS